jgi:hypothetical protein
MSERAITIRIELGGLKARLLLAGTLLGLGARELACESLTFTTTYPAPAGIYNQIITTGNSSSTPADTTFNRNAGNTILVPPGNASGSVGVGTASPKAKLHVGQGDVYVSQAARGLILKSPNGLICRRLLIDDSGNLATVALACP